MIDIINEFSKLSKVVTDSVSDGFFKSKQIQEQIDIQNEINLRISKIESLIQAYKGGKNLPLLNVDLKWKIESFIQCVNHFTNELHSKNSSFGILTNTKMYDKIAEQGSILRIQTKNGSDYYTVDSYDHSVDVLYLSRYGNSEKVEFPKAGFFFYTDRSKILTFRKKLKVIS